jgi:hypothetical protein
MSHFQVAPQAALPEAALPEAALPEAALPEARPGYGTRARRNFPVCSVAWAASGVPSRSG